MNMSIEREIWRGWVGSVQETPEFMTNGVTFKRSNNQKTKSNLSLSLHIHTRTNFPCIIV